MGRAVSVSPQKRRVGQTTIVGTEPTRSAPVEATSRWWTSTDRGRSSTSRSLPVADPGRARRRCVPGSRRRRSTRGAGRRNAEHRVHAREQRSGPHRSPGRRRSRRYRNRAGIGGYPPGGRRTVCGDAASGARSVRPRVRRSRSFVAPHAVSRPARSHRSIDSRTQPSVMRASEGRLGRTRNPTVIL